MWPHITEYEYVDENNKKNICELEIEYQILNFNNFEENKC